MHEHLDPKRLFRLRKEIEKLSFNYKGGLLMLNGFYKRANFGNSHLPMKASKFS